MNVKLIHKIKGHVGPIYDACFDGAHFLYSTAADKFVTRWNIETGIQDDFAIKLSESAYSIEIIGSNYLAIGTLTGKIHIIDVVEKKEIHLLDFHNSAIFSISFSEKLSIFISGDATGNIAIWNAIDFKIIRSIPLDCGKIRTLNFDKNQLLLAIGSQDGKIRILETDFFNEISLIEANIGGINTIIWSPKNQNMLISGGKDGCICVIDLIKKSVIHKFQAHMETIYGLIPSDFGYISASRDKTIKCWDFNMMPLKRIESKNGGHNRSINALGIINENMFYSVSDDAIIRIWFITNQSC